MNTKEFVILNSKLDDILSILQVVAKLDVVSKPTEKKTAVVKLRAKLEKLTKNPTIEDVQQESMKLASRDLFTLRNLLAKFKDKNGNPCVNIGHLVKDDYSKFIEEVRGLS